MGCGKAAQTGSDHDNVKDLWGASAGHCDCMKVSKCKSLLLDAASNERGWSAMGEAEAKLWGRMACVMGPLYREEKEPDHKLVRCVRYVA